MNSRAALSPAGPAADGPAASAGGVPVAPEAGFERLSALMADGLAETAALMEARMRAERSPLIAQVASHLIGAGGKRLRPILTLSAAALCGGAGANAPRLAAAVEFIHNATLLHDDVVDASARRRGRATANAVFGAKPSVLVGDFLFARAFQLMVETGSMEVLRVLSDAAAVIVEGEVLQLAHERDLSGGETVYFQVIRGKTAALFEAATRSGAIVAGADAARIEALAIYGEAVGLAFQIVDDLLDFGGTSATLGKNAGDDLREGKATLPVLIAYERGAEEERAFWRRVIEARGGPAADDLARALAILRERGALEETAKRAAAEAERARAALLDAFPPSELREAMIDVVAFVLARLR